MRITPIIAIGVLMATVRAAVVPGIVRQERYPQHHLAIRNPKSLGVDSVEQASGYMQVKDNSKLFFWFFESRKDPKNDPVVLWLNGGPGCSSLEGLLFENGPATIDRDLNPVRNPHSWNEVANVIYLDQPVGAGFSEGSELVSTSPQAAEDVDAFLSLFYKQFPEYTANEFHIAGESYAGRYIPVFANQIMANPNRAVSVSSIMIGNGVVDSVAEYGAYGPMLCGKGGHPQKLSDSSCAAMRRDLPGCIKALRECEQGNHHSACMNSRILCRSQLSDWRTLNPYDIRDAECTPSEDGLCYPQMDWLAHYLNKPNVKQALGAGSVEFQSCNDDVNARFNARFDSVTETTKNVTSLLERGIPVMAYYGDKDIICNWLGGQQWTTDLAWSGSKDFKAKIQHPQKWTVDGVDAGTVANHGKLTFLRVYNAGHMVPHDQPKHALNMLKQWLAKDFSLSKH